MATAASTGGEKTTANEQEQYSDFSVQTDFATFKLIVEEKTMFINSHHIAELSPVFAAMFFNEGFDEKKEQVAYIKDDTYEEILEMLRCLLPCSLTKRKMKPVTISNLSWLLKLSDKYQIENLRIYCEAFLKKDFQKEKIEDSALIALLQSAVDFNLNKEALATIIGQVAQLPTKILEESRVAKSLPGQIVGALLFTKLRITKPAQHSPLQSTPGVDGAYVTDCSAAGCAQRAVSCVLCRVCSKYFCVVHHRNDICPNIPPPAFDGKIDMKLLE